MPAPNLDLIRDVADVDITDADVADVDITDADLAVCERAAGPTLGCVTQWPVCL